MKPTPRPSYAQERAMRDAYADELQRYRPHEVEVSRERLPNAADRKRADLFTVDRDGLLRIWEFKVRATPASVGQLLVYLALCRRHYAGKRVVRPVLAAAEFDSDVTFAIEALNLGVEVVALPPAVLNAGRVLFSRPAEPIPALAL